MLAVLNMDYASCEADLTLPGASMGQEKTLADVAVTFVGRQHVRQDFENSEVHCDKKSCRGVSLPPWMKRVATRPWKAHAWK